MKIFQNSQSAIFTGMLFALTVSLSSLAPMASFAQDNSSAAATKPLDLITLGTASPVAGDSQSEAIIYDASQAQSVDADASLTPSLDVEADSQSANSPVNSQIDSNAMQDATVKTANDAQPDAEIQTLATTSAAYGSAKLGRRKISDVGLAAIGVSDTAPQDSTLDSLIWRGTPAKNAAFLLENGAVANQSLTMSALAYDVVARQSVPPMGANMIAADLVRARLAWLARAGRSNDLAVLVEQLPDTEKWASWKRWLVEHHLMSRRDDIACATVTAQIEMTLDPFWHQAKVICDAVQGNMSSARFAADVLAATGMGDPTFMGLVDELFTGKVFEDIDPTTLETIHIILMEALHRPIPIEGIAIMPPQMAQTITSLRYLSDDARMVSTYDGLQRGLVSPREAGKLWRSAGDNKDNPQSALARLDSEVSALTSAMAWRALDVDDSNAVFGLIVAAMKREITVGNGSLMLPLYAELAINALEVMQSQTTTPVLVDAAMTDNATLTSYGLNNDDAADNIDVAVPTVTLPDEAVLDDIDILLALADPTTMPAILESNNPIAYHIRTLLTLDVGNEWEADTLQTLDAWHLQPLLQAAGIDAPDISWFDLLQSGTHVAYSREKLSPVLLRACGEAAEKKRVAETILLASWLLQSTDFTNIDPVDAGLVIQYLRDVGQEKAAMGLMREIATAHLMTQFAADTQDDDAG
ncbi:MAG: hypothetical protein HOH48_00880 [Candidatus Puniceispirillum sp.]|nr:hypothetical protein [Candidatus Puniceispirillum sp.]